MEVKWINGFYIYNQQDELGILLSLKWDLDGNFMFKNNLKFGVYNIYITTIEDQTRESVSLSRTMLRFMFQVKHIVYVPNYAMV